MAGKIYSVTAHYGPFAKTTFVNNMKVDSDCDAMYAKASLLLGALIEADVIKKEWVDTEKLTKELMEFLRLHYTKLYSRFYVIFPEGLSGGKYKNLIFDIGITPICGAHIVFQWNMSDYLKRKKGSDYIAVARSVDAYRYELVFSVDDNI